MGCYIWYSEEGTGRGRSLSSFLLAVPNVIAHSSTASVPIENLYSPHNSDSSSDKIDTKYTTKIIKINLIRT